MPTGRRQTALCSAFCRQVDAPLSARQANRWTIGVVAVDRGDDPSRAVGQRDLAADREAMHEAAEHRDDLGVERGARTWAACSAGLIADGQLGLRAASRSTMPSLERSRRSTTNPAARTWSIGS